MGERIIMIDYRGARRGDDRSMNERTRGGAIDRSPAYTLNLSQEPSEEKTKQRKTAHGRAVGRHNYK